MVGIDRDPEAIDRASRRLARFGDRFRAVHAVYDEIDAVVADVVGAPVQGVLMDLGVSSLQIDETERGFSYAHDAPLDMRMDPTVGLTAADVLNTYDERALTRILRDYGEERFAQRIARAVVRRRDEQPWERSADLVDLVRASIPAATRTTGGNPAKRTFQALRIEVNGELEVLERAVPAAVDVLAVGGRIVVESYHSLEDRIVKRVLAAGATISAPAGLPVVPEQDEPYLRLLTRGPRKRRPGSARRTRGPRPCACGPPSAPARHRRTAARPPAAARRRPATDRPTDRTTRGDDTMSAQRSTAARPLPRPARPAPAPRPSLTALPGGASSGRCARASSSSGRRCRQARSRSRSSWSACRSSVPRSCVLSW